MCSIERSDVYLVNENSTLESFNRVYEIGEKSHSLLDHPRTMYFINYDPVMTLTYFTRRST